MENLIVYNDYKFKSVFVSINILLPLKKENVSKNALLAMILKKGTKKYKTEKELNRKLAELYDSSLDINVEKIGNKYNIEVGVETINPMYLKENIIDEVLGILYETICNPNINKGLFEKEIFDREKASLKQKINEEKDNKRKYALKRLEEELFKEEEYGISVLGKVEDVETITLEEISEYYEHIKKVAEVKVAIAGNLQGIENIGEKVLSKINMHFSKIKNDTEKIKTPALLQTPEIVIEKQDINQSVLCIGLLLNDIEKEDAYKIAIYDNILGGTASSKLFQNVREKESLAYFAKSTYNKHKGCIYMFAGIEPKNYDKAKALMIDQVVNLKKGDITEEEFYAAKENLISQYIEIEDSKYGIIRMRIKDNDFYGKNVSLDEIISKISQIKKEDIIKIANKIHIQKIFLLGGKNSA